MNTKSVITKKSFYEELTREKIDLSELYQQIGKTFTGKIKVIIHSPTTAGINAHISFIDDFTRSFKNNVITLEGKTTKTTFCINDLCSVNFENSAGRPNLAIDNMHTELWFI